MRSSVESDSPSTYSMTRKSSPSPFTMSIVGDDVGVADARGQARFVEEHGDELGIERELRVQALDGDRPREPTFSHEPRQVHGRHAAGRDPVEDGVATHEHGSRYGRGHRARGYHVAMPRWPGPVASTLLAGLVAGAVAGCTAIFGIDGDYRAETDAGAAADVTADTSGGHDVAASPDAEGAAPPVEAGADASDAFPAQPGPVTEVTAGRFHTCVRFGSGVAMCWGRDEDFGELGNGTMVEHAVAEPAMGSGLTKLVAGAHDTCGLVAGGGVCAGKGGTGELANGVGDADVPYPVATSVLPAAPTAIASGDSFTLRGRGRGRRLLRGRRRPAELGNGTTASAGRGAGELGRAGRRRHRRVQRARVCRARRRDGVVLG